MRVSVVALGLGLTPAIVGAQTTDAPQADDPFYRARALTLIVGAENGGGYNVYSRLLARYLPSHLPGDTSVVVQGMPGASGRRAAEYMFSSAPQDGSTIGTLEQNIPLTQVMTTDNVRFDVGKFNYLGNMSATVSTAIAWHTTGVKTIEDATTTELIVGATGQTGTTELFARLMNRTLGTKFRVINGYTGGNEINLAMERGELGGRTSYSWSSLKSTNADWLADKKIYVLVQIGLHKAADLPNTPLLLDLVKSSTNHEVVRLFSASLELGRVYLTPPNVPLDRVATLRQAFDETLADPLLLQEAQRLNIDINPTDGASVQNLIVTLTAESPTVLAQARTFLQ